MTIIIGAIVSLLIFFFEEWWKAHHPVAPTSEARVEFVAMVASWKYFWMGAKRAQYAGALFDEFSDHYFQDPPKTMSSILTRDQARTLAEKYAENLTLP